MHEDFPKILQPAAVDANNSCCLGIFTVALSHRVQLICGLDVTLCTRGVCSFGVHRPLILRINLIWSLERSAASNTRKVCLQIRFWYGVNLLRSGGYCGTRQILRSQILRSQIICPKSCVPNPAVPNLAVPNPAVPNLAVPNLALTSVVYVHAPSVGAQHILFSSAWRPGALTLAIFLQVSQHVKLLLCIYIV